MKIKTTTTINISPENEQLVSIVVAKNGGTLDGESLQDAIKRIRNNISFDTTYYQIQPHLRAYFGERDLDTVVSLEEMLRNGGIEVSTIIE